MRLRIATGRIAVSVFAAVSAFAVGSFASFSATATTLRAEHDALRGVSTVTRDVPFVRITPAGSNAAALKQQESLVPNARATLSSVQLHSAGGGVALSEDRLLSLSGGQWREITPHAERDVTSNIASTHFLDAQRGFALDRAFADAGATLWRTTDGGASWKASAIPLAADAGTAHIHFADASRGYVIAREPSSSNFSFARLYATADGGATWQELARPPAMGVLKFASAAQGWLLGGADGRSLYQTMDGGVSWQRVTALESDRGDATASRAADSTTAWALPVMLNGRVVVAALTTTESTQAASALPQMLSQFELDAQGIAYPLARASVHARTGNVRLVNADASIVITGDVRAITPLTRGKTPLNILVEPSGTAAQVSERDGARWVLTTDNFCGGKRDCVVMQQLASVDAGGLADNIAAPETSQLRSSTEAGELKRVVQSTRRGFDACEAQAISTLQTWFTASPFRDVNFYMGGRNRACSQTRLTASWLTQAMDIGWYLIPTWVGYQSPSSICTGCAKFSSSAATARTQGVDEANLAANAAEALGLTKPNIIYFNMEKYDVETSAEPAFIDGWSAQIRARGYVPGMYVHWTNVNSFVSIANPPQSVWVARWSGVGGTGPSSAPDPNAITGVSNTIFVNNRIWQHYGDVTQTYGGATVAIDMNVANGPVVGKDVAAQPQTITFGALSNRVVNTAAFNVSATASSGLAVSFISLTASTCTVAGTRVTLLGVGACAIRASQSGNASYNAAANVDQSFNIAAQTQSITFAALPSRILSPVTFDLNASASSGLLPTYSSLTTGVCTVNGDRLLTVALGTCTVRASQAGDAKVSAAASVDQSFQVVSSSSCSTATTTGDCDMDGIPNGIEASVTRNASVRDNDVFGMTRLFIMQTYRDFLKREASTAEINFWTTEFTAGRQTRASMTESFYTSADFGARHAPVARLYLAFFNRTPQFTGQQYWAGQLGTRTLAQIADAFVTSAEFTTTYGTLDDTPYVNRVYQNTLGRAPTSTELTTALNDLASGAKTRGGLMASLSESTTFQNATRNEVNTIMTYWAMLQRRADTSGFNYWVGQLDTGAKTTQGMISGFLGSAEYRSRFLP
jgi:photosystem II stability/assembly factor-like uncharacterized protein